MSSVWRKYPSSRHIDVELLRRHFWLLSSADEKRNVSWTRVDQMSRTHHCEWEFNWCVQINFPSSPTLFSSFLLSFRPPKWKAKKSLFDVAPEKPIKPTFFSSGWSEEKCCFVCYISCSTTHPDHDHVWRAMLMNSKRKVPVEFQLCCHSSSLKVSSEASQVAMCLALRRVFIFKYYIPMGDPAEK